MVGLGRGAEGVLSLKDVGWEMCLEDFETPAIGGWVRGLASFSSSLRGEFGFEKRRGSGTTNAIWGCRGLLRLTFFPLWAPPFITSRYPAIARRLLSSISLALLSLIHACAPLRPEYTHMICPNPKSCRKAASTTLIAMVMKDQHL